MDAVRTHLGEKRTWLCGLLQYLNLYGTAIAYTITTATCLGAIMKANCYHSQGRSLRRRRRPSLHAALRGVPENGAIKGSVAGVPMNTPAQKVWRVAQAIGDIAFAYPYTIVLLEIQDTLKSSPPEGETMRKGNAIAVLATTLFYLAVSCFGYAAFGNDAPGNLLTGFGFYEPYWLIDFANACIVLHLLGGYQMFSQQIFTFADRSFAARFPNSAFLNKSYAVAVPGVPASWSYVVMNISNRACLDPKALVYW